jgi:hypothetical protein
MRLFGTCLVLLSFSSVSFAAASIPEYCDVNAASFVEKIYSDSYDREGFEGFDCEVSPRGRAIICKVAASKGDGAALDTYQVVMNLKCSKAFRIDLVGEE